MRSEMAHMSTKSDLQALERAISGRLAALDRRISAIEADTSVDLPLDLLEATLEGGAAAAAAAAAADGAPQQDRCVLMVGPGGGGVWGEGCGEALAPHHP
jgi:uncharacterized protein